MANTYNQDRVSPAWAKTAANTNVPGVRHCYGLMAFPFPTPNAYLPGATGYSDFTQSHSKRDSDPFYFMTLLQFSSLVIENNQLGTGGSVATKYAPPPDEEPADGDGPARPKFRKSEPPILNPTNGDHTFAPKDQQELFDALQEDINNLGANRYDDGGDGDYGGSDSDDDLFSHMDGNAAGAHVNERLFGLRASSVPLRESKIKVYVQRFESAPDHETGKTEFRGFILWVAIMDKHWKAAHGVEYLLDYARYKKNNAHLYRATGGGRPRIDRHDPYPHLMGDHAVYKFTRRLYHKLCRWYIGINPALKGKLGQFTPEQFESAAFPLYDEHNPLDPLTIFSPEQALYVMGMMGANPAHCEPALYYDEAAYKTPNCRFNVTFEHTGQHRDLNVAPNVYRYPSNQFFWQSPDDTQPGLCGQYFPWHDPAIGITSDDRAIENYRMENGGHGEIAMIPRNQSIVESELCHEPLIQALLNTSNLSYKVPNILRVFAKNYSLRYMAFIRQQRPKGIKFRDDPRFIEFAKMSHVETSKVLDRFNNEVWNERTTLSPSLIRMIQWANSERFRMAYSPLNYFDPELDLFANMVIRDMSFGRYYRDVANVSRDWLMIHYGGLDAYRDDDKLHFNVLASGEGGVGKSFTISNATGCYIPGTVNEMVDQSAKSDFVDQDNNDSITVYGEAPQCFVSGNSSKRGEESGSRHVKDKLTAMKTAYKVFEFIDMPNGASKRTSRTVETEHRGCTFASTNAYLSNADEAMMTRFHQSFYHDWKIVGDRIIDLKNQIKNHKDKAKVEEYKRFTRKRQYMVAVANKLIQLGILPKVDDRVARLCLQKILQHLERNGVTAGAARAYERIMANARTYAIMTTIANQYYSIDSELRDEPWCMAQMLLLAPGLVISVQHIVFAFTMLSDEYFNSLDQKVLCAICEHVANFPVDQKLTKVRGSRVEDLYAGNMMDLTGKPIDSKSIDWARGPRNSSRGTSASGGGGANMSAMYTGGQQQQQQTSTTESRNDEIIDLNYIWIKGEIRQLAEEAKNYLSPTPAHQTVVQVITDLCKQDIIAENYIEPIAESKIVAASNSATCLPRVKKTIKMIKKRVRNEEGDYGICVAIEALHKFKTDLLYRALQTLEYKDLKRRKLLLGVSVDGYPDVLQTMVLEPNPNEELFSTPNMAYMPKMDRAIAYSLPIDFDSVHEKVQMARNDVEGMTVERALSVIEYSGENNQQLVLSDIGRYTVGSVTDRALEMSNESKFKKLGNEDRSKFYSMVPGEDLDDWAFEEHALAIGYAGALPTPEKMRQRTSAYFDQPGNERMKATIEKEKFDYPRDKLREIRAFRGNMNSRPIRRGQKVSEGHDVAENIQPLNEANICGGYMQEMEKSDRILNSSTSGDTAISAEVLAAEQEKMALDSNGAIYGDESAFDAPKRKMNQLEANDAPPQQRRRVIE
jgi:hypothetical protein